MSKKPIRGDTVGTTSPRPDFNQNNPRKADYIKNRPLDRLLPDITSDDNGKGLKVKDGKWVLAPYGGGGGGGDVDIDEIVSAVIAELPTATVYDGAVIITNNNTGGEVEPDKPDEPIEPDEPTTVNFTVNGVSYTADTGMTFGEFINSSYNINNIFKKGEETMAGTFKVLYNGRTLCLGEDFVLTNETIISDKEYDFAPTFDFKVNSVTYSAEYGMTWAKFIESGYNTDGIRIDETLGVVSADGKIIVDKDNNGFTGDEPIIEGYEYIYTEDYVEPEISFTVDGNTYTAKRGMTWGQFIASSYNTDGLFAKGDEVADVTPISFTIDGESYNAEEGMTFEKWISNTTYNTRGFYAYDDGVHVDKDGVQYHIENVSLTDTISAGAELETTQY